MNQILTSTISVVIVNRGNRAVDRKLLKVGTSVAVDLGIEIGEDAALQQRVVGEVNPTHDMAWLKLIGTW